VQVLGTTGSLESQEQIATNADKGQTLFSGRGNTFKAPDGLAYEYAGANNLSG
jgi:hypothetical protein